MNQFKGQGWYLTYGGDIVAGPYSDWSEVTGEMMSQNDPSEFTRIRLDTNGNEMRRTSNQIRALSKKIMI